MCEMVSVRSLRETNELAGFLQLWVFQEDGGLFVFNCTIIVQAQ